MCHRDAVDPLPRRRGLGGAALRVAHVDRLTGVYSRHRTLRPRPSSEAMWIHQRTVRALMDCGPVLPMRFGTMLADEAALVEAVTARRDEFVACLDRLRGRVELGLRVVADRRSRAGRSALHEPLAALAHEARLRAYPAPPTILAAAYLVERADIPAFRAEAERAAAVLPGVRAVCTGPWPPYSFVEVDGQ
jgi:hypothetical protein